MTTNKRAAFMSNEIINHKDKVYEDILAGGNFHPWVGPEHIKRNHTRSFERATLKP